MATIVNEREDTGRVAFVAVVAIVAGAAVVLFAYGAITVPPLSQHADLSMPTNTASPARH
jgi:hypothetical protein